MNDTVVAKYCHCQDGADVPYSLPGAYHLSSLSSKYYIGTINSNQRLEFVNTIEFEDRLKERIQTRHLKLKESNNLLDCDVLMNEIEIFESILRSLSDLKYGDKTRAIEIAETNDNFLQVIHLRNQLNSYRSCNTWNRIGIGFQKQIIDTVIDGLMIGWLLRGAGPDD